VGGGWWRILGVFVAYHTALVWMTGQTLGKAVANLEVRRADGQAYERTARGLGLTLGRASVGYLLVDMLGLGVLVALPARNADRQCLHDLVFGTRVVLLDELEWGLPKVRKRLSDFALRREEASADVQEKQGEPRRLSGLWQWMVTGALGLEKVLDMVQGTVTRVSHWFGGPGHAHAGSATLSTKTAAVVSVGTGAVTVGAVATAAMLTGAPAAPTVVGTWTGTKAIYEVVETEPGSYVGRNLNDIRKGPCVWKAHERKWLLTDPGPTYHGQVRWAYIEDPCLRFFWDSATFKLDDKGTADDPSDDVLRICTAPSSDNPDGCSRYERG